jgi:hypothetical protein
VEVWDPKDKPTVFRRIKKLILSPERGLKVPRYIIYPGILLIFIFLSFFLSSCAAFNIVKGTGKVVDKILPEDDQDVIIVSDLDSNVETDESANTIACIKLQPECNVDLEN